MKPLDAYLASLQTVIATLPGDTPSGVFELNTSRQPGFCQWVMRHGASPGGVSSIPLGCILKAALRDLAKWLSITLLARVFYRQRRRHLNALEQSRRIFAGFVTERNSRLVAKDFDGFRDTLPPEPSALTLGLRLPYLGMRKYLSGDEDVLPVLAHARLTDVLAGLMRQWKLARAMHYAPGVGAPAKMLCISDMLSGHAVASFVIGKTVSRLARRSSQEATIYLPMERHDWEQIALFLLEGARRTEAVQNCTFSPADLNMYHTAAIAPRYRQVMPHELHVLDTAWERVFREALGFSCKVTPMTQHRFSGTRFSLVLDGQTPRLIYLASINREKLAADLGALSALLDRVAIEVRLHPSLNDYPLPAGFTRSNDLSGPYGGCVFADTSMVFQLNCARENLIFIEHDTLPNQNPTRWFPDFGSRQIPAAQLGIVVSPPSPTAKSLNQHAPFCP